MRYLCVRESAPLSAYDVTGHGQKDLARISQGLDIYFNFFCQVKCVIYSLYETKWARRLRCVAVAFDLKKTLKEQTHAGGCDKENTPPYTSTYS